MNRGTTALLIVIGLIVLFIIYSISDNNHRNEIQVKITEMKGEVISIDSKGIFSNHPFHWVNTKSDRIYKITYKLNNEEKIGWVIFRAFSTDWKFD